MNIYIEIETFRREWMGWKRLLSSVPSGFRLVIGNSEYVRLAALNSSGGVFIVKSLTPAEIPFYQDLRNRNHSIFLMPSEGVYNGEDHSAWHKSNYPPSCMPYLDIVFAWGPVSYTYLMNVMDESKIVKLGVPRFDLPTDLTFFNSKIIRRILISTNFSAAIPSMGMSNFERFIKHEPSIQNLLKENFNDWVKDRMYLLKKYIMLAKKLDALGYTVSVRPHPSEDVSYYSEAFIGTNILVDSRDQIDVQLKNNDLLIHYDSTTGLDALCSRVPSIAYVPDVFPTTCLVAHDFSSIYKSSSNIIRDLKSNEIIPLKDIESNLVFHNSLSEQIELFWDAILRHMKKSTVIPISVILISNFKWFIKSRFYKVRYQNKIQKLSGFKTTLNNFDFGPNVTRKSVTQNGCNVKTGKA